MTLSTNAKLALSALLGASLCALFGLIFEARYAPKFADPACRAFYLDDLRPNAENNIRIRLVFGYKDARPARFVGDIYERNAFVERLVSPCLEKNDYACGFTRNPHDMDLFTRRMGWPTGPASWRFITINLRVVASSTGPDDEENRVDAYQKWRSGYAMKVFLRGLKTAQVVLYDGHSRDGGGPDFEPPRLTQLGHVDYDWYKKNRPGLNDMVRAAGGCKWLGLFSCASDELFTRRLKTAVPELKLLTLRKLVYYADALNDVREALSGILGMTCRPELLSQAGKSSKN